ncbi:MAG: hypothetical protein AB7Q97_23535 [Gammaproteobacteria bacterium]
MLRISVDRNMPGLRRLVLEGRLVGPWVRELSVSVDGADPARAPDRLDLQGVHFVDGEGLALLRALRARGIGLENPSPFVRDLLDGEG